jgi:hypothetical protein
VVLLGAALGAARLFGSGGPFGLALGLWMYFLVQSAYFLFLRPQVRSHGTAASDPFDEAHQRALALLEHR